MSHTVKTKQTMSNEILYILLPDFASHEIVYLAQAIASDEYALKENPKYVNKIVAPTMEPVKSIGGSRTLPDYSFDAMPDDYAALVLIGGFGWSTPIAEQVVPIVRYLNIVPIERLDRFDEIEGLMFLVTPDMLSGLFAWANFDSTDPNAVMCPWGSGCASAITTMVNENRLGGKHCFIGMLDVSARQFFRSDILSFTIPKSRFMEMCGTMRQCCVSGSPAWLKVKKRINNNPINRQ